MLTREIVLKYIKSHLGYPYSTIEILDDEFIDYFTQFTICDFSRYIPNRNILKVNDSINIEKIDTMSCRIHDPDGKEIISIEEIVTGIAYPAYYMTSGNIDGLLNYLADFKLRKLAGQWGVHEITFDFTEPNLITFHTRYPNEATIIYNRVHSFETITMKTREKFLDLCYADALRLLGAIRENVRTINTPVGTIEISADVKSTGESLRRDILNELSEKATLNRFIGIVGDN